MDSGTKDILHAAVKTAYLNKGKKPPADCMVNLEMLNDPGNKMQAYLVYDLLRQHGVIKGDVKIMSIDAMNQKLPIAFGENAGLFPIKDDKKYFLFHLNFGKKTPDQVRQAVDAMVVSQEQKEAKPSELAAAVPNFISLVKASRLPFKSINAQGHQFVINVEAESFDNSAWHKFTTALVRTGLLTPNDIRTLPTTIETDEGLAIRIPVINLSTEVVNTVLQSVEVSLRAKEAQPQRKTAGICIDSEVKRVLEDIASVQHGKTDKPPHVVDAVFSDNESSRFMAYRAYEALRQHGAIDGTRGNISLQDFLKPLPLVLGDNAALQSVKKPKDHFKLHLSFGNRTPAEIKSAVESILHEQERSAAVPSEFESALPAFQSVARAAGLHLKNIHAVSNSIVITTTTTSGDFERITRITNAMRSEGLMSNSNILTRPVHDKLSATTLQTTIPLLGKSAQEVESALFNAEIALREREGSHGWSDRVTRISLASPNTRIQ